MNDSTLASDWRQEWEKRCHACCDEAVKGTGGSDYLFFVNFSQRVDEQLDGLPEQRRAEAVAIARRFNYLTPEERRELTEENSNDGLCQHGLDPMCCPCGCGDL